MAKRRSKRRTSGATRFSARRQAQVQQAAAVYGSDYGILPSGTSGIACIVPTKFSFEYCRLIHGESLGYSREVSHLSVRIESVEGLE